MSEGLIHDGLALGETDTRTAMMDVRRCEVGEAGVSTFDVVPSEETLAELAGVLEPLEKVGVLYVLALAALAPWRHGEHVRGTRFRTCVLERSRGSLTPVLERPSATTRWTATYLLPNPPTRDAPLQRLLQEFRDRGQAHLCEEPALRLPVSSRPGPTAA